MKIDKISTSNPEQEDIYIKTITFYLDMNDEEIKRRNYNFNRKNRRKDENK